MSKLSGIYCILNKITNEIYYGKSVNLRKRKYEQFRWLRKNKHWNSYLQNAYNEYGEVNLEFKVLLFCESFEFLRYENFFIYKNGLYNIYKKGFIRKLKTKYIKNPNGRDLTITNSGYYKVGGKLLHRILWEENIGKIPDGMEVNHKDGNKLNNDLNNLELVTHKENSIHAHKILKTKTGVNTGEKNGRAKLNWGQVHWIRKEKDNYTQIELSKIFNISNSQINNIIKNKKWKA